MFPLPFTVSNPPPFPTIPCSLWNRASSSWDQDTDTTQQRAAGRFLNSFHTLCLLPSQYHFHQHNCEDNQNWGPLLSICSIPPTPNQLRLKACGRPTPDSWSLTKGTPPPPPSKFLAIIFLEGCHLCSLIVRFYFKTESKIYANFSCNKTVWKTNKVQLLQR